MQLMWVVRKSQYPTYYLTAEEIFNIIEATHATVKHGGRDRLENETSRKYDNVTT